MKFLGRWILSALAIGITAYLIPSVSVTLTGAFVLAIVLGIINTFIKPVILLLALPLTILTLGIFSLLVNGLLILLTAYIVPGFAVHGFLSALVFAVVLSLVNAFFHVLGRN
jgi:putative membrane protein